MPDSRSLDVVLVDLEHAGFKDLVFVTDHHYFIMQVLLKLPLHNPETFNFVAPVV